jgi:hypothetical protein
MAAALFSMSTEIQNNQLSPEKIILWKRIFFLLLHVIVHRL